MSDKRATYVIGAVAASLALVLGLITAVPASTITVNSSGVDMMGHAFVVLKDMDGNIKAYQQTDNIVPLNGQDCAAGLIFGTTTADFCDENSALVFTDIEIGSSTQDPAVTDTGLVLPSGLDRTGNLIGGSPAVAGTGSIKIIEGTFTLTGALTVAEVGLFNEETLGQGDMISRFELTQPISAGTDDTITITYVFEVGSG